MVSLLLTAVISVVYYKSRQTPVAKVLPSLNGLTYILRVGHLPCIQLCTGLYKVEGTEESFTRDFWVRQPLVEVLRDGTLQ